MLPNMGSLLIYLKGLGAKGKKAAAFGTFGWAGGAQKDMEELLAKSCFDAVEPGFNCKWTPQQVEIEAAEKYGYDFALKLKAE